MNIQSIFKGEPISHPLIKIVDNFFSSHLETRRTLIETTEVIFITVLLKKNPRITYCLDSTKPAFEVSVIDNSKVTKRSVKSQFILLNKKEKLYSTQNNNQPFTLKFYANKSAYDFQKNKSKN